MTLEQIKLILADSVMDLPYPLIGTPWSRQTFAESCYTKWASTELFNYIIQETCFQQDIPRKKLADVIQKFEEKMRGYSEVCPKNEIIFETAGRYARNIREIIEN